MKTTIRAKVILEFTTDKYLACADDPTGYREPTLDKIGEMINSGMYTMEYIMDFYEGKEAVLIIKELEENAE